MTVWKLIIYQAHTAIPPAPTSEASEEVSNTTGDMEKSEDGNDIYYFNSSNNDGKLDKLVNAHENKDYVLCNK